MDKSTFELRIKQNGKILFKVLSHKEIELTSEDLARLYSLIGNGLRGLYENSYEKESSPEENTRNITFDETKIMMDYLRSQSDENPERMYLSDSSE